MMGDYVNVHENAARQNKAFKLIAGLERLAGTTTDPVELLAAAEGLSHVDWVTLAEVCKVNAPGVETRRIVVRFFQVQVDEAVQDPFRGLS